MKKIDITPKIFLIILSAVFVLILLITAIYINSVISGELPSIEELENPKQNFATQVFSADGELLDHFYIERRVNISFDSIPKNFINALIATEDRKFYDHWGVHTIRIIKAAVKNVLAMRTKEGASTITMQLARNLYHTFENSMRRKIREAFTAIQIEKTYTKDEILEMYTNTVAFGRGAYGLAIAAKVYFDKSPSDLTLTECAYLVGILKAPEHYNGINDYDKALKRRNLVLNLMHEQDLINNAEYATAIEEPITLQQGMLQKKRKSELAPHFVEMIRQKLGKGYNLNGYDLYSDGLIIYTTLNATIQRYANQAVEEHLSKYQGIFNKSFSWGNNRKLLEELITKAVQNRPEYIAAPENKKSDIDNLLRKNKNFIDSVKNSATTVQVGLVVIDPMTGAILAMVGSSPKFMQEHPDAKYSLNHVTQIRRQPGSSVKPFVYSSALQQGLTPQSMIECGPFTYINPDTKEAWTPRGTGHCGPGEKTTLYQGLINSINTVSARLITEVTTPLNVVQLAKQMGIESSLRAVPALSLGAGGEVSLEMASAFGTFPNQGIHVEPYFITRIENQFGNMLQSEKKSAFAADVLSKRITNQMTYMMEGVVNYGTGSKVRETFKDIAAAGKTGTTNDYTDAWFIGFTPQLVCAVWVGFDDSRITFTGGYGYAAQAAAPLFGILMSKIYSDPKLPYKQKEFLYTRDSLFMDSLRVLPRTAVPSKLQQVQTADVPQTKIKENNNPEKINDKPKEPKKEDNKPKSKFPALPKKTDLPDKRKLPNF